jgi:hypothetical protein
MELGSVKGETPLTANLFLLVFSILDTSQVDSALVGEQQTARCEVLVSGEQNSVQHAFEKEHVTHPLNIGKYRVERKSASDSGTANVVTVNALTSDIMMSTFSTGNVTSSSFPLISTISKKNRIRGQAHPFLRPILKVTKGTYCP